MKKLEIVAAVVIVLATVIILNTCSSNFEMPQGDPEVNAETSLE